MKTSHIAPSRRMIRLKCRVKQQVTVAEAAEGWMEAASRRLKRSTCSAYGVILSSHIIPRFGGRAIAAVSGGEIEEYLGELVRGGLSGRTAANVSTVLRGVMAYAAGAGYINKAPVWTAPPQGRGRQAQVLSMAERRGLEEYLINNINNKSEKQAKRLESLGVLLCLCTGMRLGEICALRWGDVARDGQAIHIRRTAQRVYDAGGGTRIILDTPKSASSDRVIPVPRSLRGMIGALRAGDGCFVLTGGEKFIEPRTMQNRFKAILRGCGLREVNFHALRHTFATECVEAGFDAKTVSSVLGHADVSVTLNTYVHPSFNSMERMMDGVSGDFSQSAPFAKGTMRNPALSWPYSCAGRK